MPLLNPYDPPALLRNRHVQSVLAGLKLRRPLVVHRAKNMLACAEPVILGCPDGVRLKGWYSKSPAAKGRLAILIHGWEGSAESLYLLSAAGHLYTRGFDVFRLNLRDHGNTHHLNRGLFHSCLIDEVVGAVTQIQANFPHDRLFLGGFSLGGNFSLRVAARAPRSGIRLSKVVAVSPVIDPAKATVAIETGWWLYHAYFLKKWRRSLARKRSLFPEMTDLGDLGRYGTLTEMTDFLTARFTDFPDTVTYFKGYTITRALLKRLAVPVHIIASLDDPVIPAEDLKALDRIDSLTIETTTCGGHCGFLKNWRLQSWADERMADLFAQA